MEDSKEKQAMELLGQVCDLSTVYISGSFTKGTRQYAFQCRFCKQHAQAPPLIAHTHNCLVARITDFLRRNQT
jgi:hypothetical protein